MWFDHKDRRLADKERRVAACYFASLPVIRLSTYSLPERLIRVDSHFTTWLESLLLHSLPWAVGCLQRKDSRDPGIVARVRSDVLGAESLLTVDAKKR